MGLTGMQETAQYAAGDALVDQSPPSTIAFFGACLSYNMSHKIQVECVKFVVNVCLPCVQIDTQDLFAGRP